MRVRRMLAALCAGLAMLTGLQCVRLMVATRPIVIATRTITRGSTIPANALAIREIADDAALEHAFRAVEEAVGMTAQVDIPENGIVVPAMARASPTVSKGHTAIEVSLASSADDLIPGDVVMLSGAAIDQGPNTDPPTENESAGDKSTGDTTTGTALQELCPNAILMAKPTQDANGNITAVFAMRPEEAATVLRAQTYNAIIAVSAE